MNAKKNDWSAIIACEVRGPLISAEYCIVLWPYTLTNGFPKLSITTHREGGTFPIQQALRDSESIKVIKKAKADWFIPYMEKMSRGESVGLWEIYREYELQHSSPMHVLPPGTIPDEDYCRYYFHVDEDRPEVIAELRAQGINKMEPSQPVWRRPTRLSSPDESWRVIIAGFVADQPAKANEIIYYPDLLIDNTPALSIKSYRNGEPVAATHVFESSQSHEAVVQAGGEWFLDFVKRLLAGDQIRLWEIMRSYEQRHMTPPYVVPPKTSLTEYLHRLVCQNM